jgi:transposase InsO family protein
VLDLFARRPIGWALSLSPDTELTKRALTMAFEARGKPKVLCFILIRAVITPAKVIDNYCGVIELNKA